MGSDPEIGTGRNQLQFMAKVGQQHCIFPFYFHHSPTPIIARPSNFAAIAESV